MKNPAWDDSVPHSREEMKAEIGRLIRDIQQMHESIEETQERTARSREITERNLRRVREQLHAEGVR